MADTLFDKDKVIGTFRGFSEGGMEFHADLVLPHKNTFQAIAMHGQFVLVQLEHDREAVLGRITSIASQGRLVSPIGEDYAIRAVRDQREIPEELRDQYLKYKVDIRILGVLRQSEAQLVFVPSHRRLPHVGAQVSFPADDLLAEIANATSGHGAELGFLAHGEFIYAGDDQRLDRKDWMAIQRPAITPRFEISKLIARRSFVFARAGFGKSNLIKLLFSALYSGEKPTVARRGDEDAPVGTVIFDPDGEYYWPDHQNRPGLCDVPALADQLVVFTDKTHPSPIYQSFVVGQVKLDIRQLPPSRVLGIALAPERQDHQNVAKLKGLNREDWRELINEIYHNHQQSDPAKIRKLLRLKSDDDVQIQAAVSNVSRVVRALHDPSSQLLDALKTALREGKLCVVDISRMRGEQGLQLAGIILEDIFEYNQEQFTKTHPASIPTIAVFEEAQSVLGAAGQSENSSFVSWVKEGRKYDLGAVMITQQPGSIPTEIVSQGDNFFVFHLLSAGDLTALQRANAHFSNDLLAALLNEPLVGHGVYWSSAPGTDQHARPYPLSIRVLSFDKQHQPCDLTSEDHPSDEMYASRLRKKLDEAVANALHDQDDSAADTDAEAPAVPDIDEAHRQRAFAGLADSAEFSTKLHSDEGIPWWRVAQLLEPHAPTMSDNPNN